MVPAFNFLLVVVKKKTGKNESKQIPVMVLMMEKHVVQKFKKLRKRIHFFYFFKPRD